MAKKGKINHNNLRKKLVDKYYAKRIELRKIIKSPYSSIEERDDAILKLYKLPRNSMPTRYRNRCSLTGRPRGHLRNFGLSRITFREMATNSMIPGVTKASW